MLFRSSTGIVTAKSVTTQSTAVITFTSTSKCTGSITVTVNPALAISGTLTATVGGTSPILLINGNTTAASSSWGSSDQNVATVDPTTPGKIVAVGDGTTTITYTDPATSCEATATFVVSAAPRINRNSPLGHLDRLSMEPHSQQRSQSPHKKSPDQYKL